MITIANDGGHITSTNYWDTDIAKAGKFFVSINAGTVRLLVPPKMAAVLTEFVNVREIALTLGPEGALEILLDDHTDAPYSIQLSKGQLDRRWPARDDGKWVPFLVYEISGATSYVGRCYLRRAEHLPYLEPVPL